MLVNGQAQEGYQLAQRSIDLFGEFGQYGRAQGMSEELARYVNRVGLNLHE